MHCYVFFSSISLFSWAFCGYIVIVISGNCSVRWGHLMTEHVRSWFVELIQYLVSLNLLLALTFPVMIANGNVRKCKGFDQICNWITLKKIYLKILGLLLGQNRFWGITVTESIFKIKSFKRCQNDRTNGAVIWYFHHPCLLFKLAEQS